ncbi:MAG TPA: hypothetical protein VEP68_11960 [Anaeromyxobacteraceae bacterium]|nr:hypothetical protein [Anaeromyxobacteraceae bacterium]
MLRLPFPSVSTLGPGFIPRLLGLLSPPEPPPDRKRAPPSRLGEALRRWLEEEL